MEKQLSSKYCSFNAALNIFRDLGAITDRTLKAGACVGEGCTNLDHISVLFLTTPDWAVPFLGLMIVDG